MLYWAAVFFIISLIAAYLGYGGIAANTQTIAIWLFWIFLIIFVITFISGLLRRRRK